LQQREKIRTLYKFASHSRAPFRLWNFVILERWNIENLVQMGFVVVNMSTLPQEQNVNVINVRFQTPWLMEEQSK